MNVLIVYDSVFGNTERIARAIGDSLDSRERVRTLRVTDVKPEHLAGLDVLIVGSPTRGFRPTGAIVSFLKQIPDNSLQGLPAAAFDTRIALEDIKSSIFRSLVKMGGWAAKPIADRLRGKGANLLLPPEGFVVKGSQGPLREGELERAAGWALRLIEEIEGR